MKQLDRINFRDWIDTPEAWFITPEEKVEWNKAITLDAAQKFIADYEARRGPAFVKDLEARIKFADDHFATNSIKGSETEMGRVWLILGSPNQQSKSRGGSVNASEGAPLMGANSSIEQNAFQRTTWTYRKDRLPEGIGSAEMTVIFQTDVNRGFQTIENPGLIEPFLKKAAAFYGQRMINAAAAARASVAAAAPMATTATPAAAAVAADPALWNAPANLRGAFFTGESFISPTEKPFYAYSFYLPASVASLAGAKDVVLVGSIKDPEGKEVAVVRQPVTPSTYDETGDRYVDGAVPIPPGKYTGAFGLYTADGSTLLATARTEFEVADPTATRVTRPFLTSHIDTFDKQGVFDPFTFIAMKYAVKGNKTFRKADGIGYFAFIANPTVTSQPSMTMRMRVSRDGKLIETTPLMPADLSQTGPHTYLVATRFEPNTLSPGHYTLELTLRDMNAPKDSDAYKKGYVNTAEFDVTP